MPTYEILVEDARERRASEVEVERKDTEADKIATEREEIAASSTYYFNQSIISFVIGITLFLSLSYIDRFLLKGKVPEGLANPCMLVGFVSFFVIS